MKHAALARGAEARATGKAGPGKLLQALGELCRETGRGPAPAGEAVPRAAAPVSPGVGLDSEDEKLLADLRSGLLRLAGIERGEPDPAVRGALDGAEFVARGELMSGHPARLPQLLPSFVFLVLLPLSGRAEALRLSERASRLLERTPQTGW